MVELVLVMEHVAVQKDLLEIIALVRWINSFYT